MLNNNIELSVRMINKSFTKYHTTQIGTPNKYGSAISTTGITPCRKISRISNFFVLFFFSTDQEK